MRIGSSHARRRDATTLLAAASLAAALVMSGCTSTPVADPTAPLTMQTDVSVEPFPSTTAATRRSSSPSPTGSSDAGDSSAPSTVSSTVATTSGSSPRPTVTAPPMTKSRSTSSSPPPTTTFKPPATSQKPPTLKPPVTLTDGPISAQEAADRKAVEKAWVKYWGVFTNMMKVPPDQRREVYGRVAVDPQLANMIKDAAYGDKEKLGNYGSVTHHFSWPVSIAVTGKPVLADCMDQSKFGILDIAKGIPLTHGGKRVNLQATFTQTGGAWKLVGYIEKAGTPC